MFRLTEPWACECDSGTIGIRKSRYHCTCMLKVTKIVISKIGVIKMHIQGENTSSRPEKNG